MDKVLLIINGLGLGGAESQLILLANKLIEKKIDVTVYLISGDVSQIDKLNKKIKLSIYDLSNDYHLLLYKLYKIIFNIYKLKPNTIHSHLYQSNILSRIIKLLFPNIRIINTTHCIYAQEKIFGLNPYLLYRLTKHLVDIHTAVSVESLNYLIDKKSIKKDNVLHIPNGITINEHLKKINNSNIFEWVAVGRLIPVKDFENLIYACVKLKSNNLNFELHIYGDGFEKQSLINLVNDLNLNNFVVFKGISSNIQNVLYDYDAMVISSKSEGLPMVLLEAMNAKLPIVSTTVGQVVEILQQSKGGFLVETNNSNALADAMGKLMKSNFETLSLMGLNNFNFIIEKYNIENIVDKWLKLYFK